MYTLVQGSTPVHNFNLPATMREVFPAVMYITYSQRGSVRLEKTLNDRGVRMSDGVVTVQLSQDDTFKFLPYVNIQAQIRFKTASGQAFVSNEVQMDVRSPLKKGTI